MRETGFKQSSRKPLRSVKPKNKFLLLIFLLGFLVGGLYGGFVMYYKYNNVETNVYACYYGARDPWMDMAARGMYFPENPYINRSFDLRCVANESVSCGPGYNTTFVGQYRLFRGKLDRLILDQHSVYDVGALNVSFYGLCLFGSCVHNKAPYQGVPS